MDRADLGSIAWKARSLAERLAVTSAAPAGPAAAGDDASARRLRRYTGLAGRGNPETFRRRLEWDGIEYDTLRQVLADAEPESDTHLPPWADTLAGIVAASTAVPAQPGGFERGTTGRPFEDVWMPTVIWARECLASQIDFEGRVRSAGIEDSALDDLVRGLLAQLSETAAPTLYEEFNHIRPVGLRALAALVPTETASQSSHLYERFVTGLRGEGLVSLFKKYPVLARLISVSIDDWLAAQTDFLNRLIADLPSLRAQLVSPTASVIAFEVDMSDRHSGGRSVVIVRFADGSRVVYKPRDVGIEVAYNSLLTWLNNEFDDEFRLRALHVIEKSGYGWVEFAAHAPISDVADAERYYRRAGRLLCVLYVLGATDCHDGNLIAAADDPVLIDLEALVYHQLGWLEVPKEEREILSADLDQLWDSVLRTGMLPTWYFGRDKRFAVDTSALSCPDEGVDKSPTPTWTFVNTDYMITKHVIHSAERERNVVVLGGEVVSPNDHVDSIVRGFTEMYDMIAQRSAELVATGGVLEAFGDKVVRFIFRNTETYGMLLEHSLDPRFLRCGLDRSIELEYLSRALLHSDDRPMEWPIVVAEIEALERLDIPHFQTTASSTSLTLGSAGVIDELFEHSGYERTRQRVARLQPADRELQAQMIRGSFYAKLANRHAAANGAGGAVDTGTTRTRTSLDETTVVRHAARIAAELDHRAINLTRGAVSWMHLDYAVQSQRFNYQPVNTSLYEGVCGIALFLAAYGTIADDAPSRALSVRALQSFRNLLSAHRASSGHRVPAALGLGGGIGLGSVLYAMTTIGQLLGDDALIDDAGDLARLLTPELIRRDTDLDVQAGSAGGILGLLKLYEVAGDPGVLAKAMWCGDHLLSKRTVIADGVSGWMSPGEKVPTGGMSHGASGIAMALARLHAHSKEQAYLRAAKEGLAYERTLFDPALDDWRDMRVRPDGDELPRSAPGWCNGSPGIGLSRLAIARSAPAHIDPRDVERALRPSMEQPLVELDSLCCGNFGRIEFLLVAGHQLDRPDVTERARELTALSLDRAARTGGFEFIPSVPKTVFSPGFFRGSAGAAYQLLRLAHPDVLPSVLIWD